MRLPILVMPVFALACSATAPEIAEEDVGAIALEIAAGPSDATCLKVAVSGAGEALAVRSVALTPGMATTASLSGLPVGPVSVRGEAFSVACASVTASSVPTWLTPAMPATLVSGTAVPVTLFMQRPGQINVSVDWPTMASALDGFMFTMPCQATLEQTVCSLRTGACPTNTDVALRGHLGTDQTVTLGGTPGTSYSITLRVQGEVEAKAYSGGTDANNTLASPSANGFRNGGAPVTSDAYAVYMIRVTNPGGAITNYYLNSLVPPGVSDRTTYGVDYTATIQAQGGATVRLVASDANCSLIRNCGPSGIPTCADPLTPANIEPTTVARNPSFNFSSPYNGQWLALTVKNVTTP